ncbi:MAG: DegT/DnrJ/EryC1/StrS family aminotransferase [bacterium]|nr:DegT/DnrJ/EryC1/StrS family aminotransferase [bacterium]
MKIPFIDLTRQYKNLELEIDKVVKDTFSRGDFILGENVEKFEKEFATFCGVKYCVGVASGTDALLLSLRALGVGPGDEVITTSFTFIATILPILYLGAKPILVDINPDTYQIEAKEIEKVITKKTKAIIPVHLFGIPAPMNEITKIAKKYKLYVIEDACQAHGAEINKERCGSFGDLAAFSFYPTKSLGAPGDAGAIVTNNKKLADNICILRNVGRTQAYKHDLLGYNSRLDTLHAGVLLIKLKRLEEWNDKRRKLAQLYDKLLTDLPIVLPPTPSNSLRPNCYMYTVRTPKRDKLSEFLRKNGVSCAIYYPIPTHLQKALRELGYTRGDFPIAERTAREVLSLPLYPELKEVEIRYICAKIREFF